MSLLEYIEGINQMLENAKEETTEDESNFDTYSMAKTQ